MNQTKKELHAIRNRLIHYYCGVDVSFYFLVSCFATPYNTEIKNTTYSYTPKHIGKTEMTKNLTETTQSLKLPPKTQE